MLSATLPPVLVITMGSQSILDSNRPPPPAKRKAVPPWRAFGAKAPPAVPRRGAEHRPQHPDRPPPYLVQDPGHPVKQNLEEMALVKSRFGVAGIKGSGGRGPPPRGRVGTARLDLAGGVMVGESQSRGPSPPGMGTPPHPDPVAAHHAQGIVHVGVVATFLHARGGLRLLGDQAEEAGREGRAMGRGIRPPTPPPHAGAAPANPYLLTTSLTCPFPDGADPSRGFFADPKPASGKPSVKYGSSSRSLWAQRRGVC